MIIKTHRFSRWFQLGLLAVLALGSLTGCRGSLDRLTQVKGKVELLVSYKMNAAAFKFSPDMTKVIFPYEKDEKDKWALIYLEQDRKRWIDPFADQKCGVYDVRWLNEDLFITDSRGHKCNLLVNSQDLSITLLSGELVKAPIEEELIELWKSIDPLYYVPLFGPQAGWLLILDETMPRQYSLGLGYYDLEALLEQLGDDLVVVERKVHGPKVYSPDGTMYVEHGSPDFPLRIHSREGELLAQAEPERSEAVPNVHGWTPDGRGVYFVVSSRAIGSMSLFLLRLP